MVPGEIIKFPGNRHEPETSQDDQLDNEQESHEHLDLNNLTEMLFYLAALRRASGPPKANNIELRRSLLVSKTTNQELYTLVNRSTEADWQAFPTYYDAIIAELKNRELLPNF
ncbi:MAG: hypothetical protein RB292_01570 [Patescibacteria group bacterium]|jgi:hypothetical protein|nr:hypothetical protein [Patescibacteria group bacterium]